MDKFIFYSDPGHGWLAVPMGALYELGIVDRISPYSYFDRDKGVAYLEEDLDASTFYNARQAAGRPYEWDNIYHENTWIRSLPAYPSHNQWRARAYG